MNFDLDEWQEAIDTFRQAAQTDESLRLVLSEHWATEGFWIEQDPQDLPPTDHLYTLAQVDGLEARIKYQKSIETPDNKNTFIK